MSERRPWHYGKDIYLYVGAIPSDVRESMDKLGEILDRDIIVAYIYDSRRKAAALKAKKSDADILIPVDFSSNIKIVKAIKPFMDRFLAVTCRSESQIHKFRELIPHVPYLRTPSMDSLTWSSDKIWMRRRLKSYDPKITPKYMVVDHGGKEIVEKIAKKLKFPVVVKPAGLAQSILVNLCFHEEELEKALRVTFKRIRSIYKSRESNEEARVLVEQFIEGGMHSIDGYVTSRGKLYFCPVVDIKTGRNIGFDDFFGYQQSTPTTLSRKSVSAAQDTTAKAVHALGLRNTSFHSELIRSDDSWKIVEVGARIGGFRQQLYKMSYGFDHGLNDALIRIPEKPIISRRKKGHSVAMKFFSKHEGKLSKLTGLKKATELQSFVKIDINKKVGDMCRFAKNGGMSVFNIILFNKDKSQLLADIRRLEQMVKIVTKGRSRQ